VNKTLLMTAKRKRFQDVLLITVNGLLITVNVCGVVLAERERANRTTDYSECLVAILNADYGLIGFIRGN